MIDRAAIPMATEGLRRTRWNGLLSEYEAAATVRMKPKQARAEVAAIRRFLWRQSVPDPGRITTAAVAAFLAGLRAAGRSAKTIINVRGALMSFCGFLVRRGVLAENPCAGIRCAKPQEVPPPALLSREEIDAVLAAAAGDPWLRNFVAVAISTGLRLGELCRLKWSDVDPAARCLTVAETKGRLARVVSLCAEAMAALADQRRICGAMQWVFPARHTWRGGGYKWLDRPCSTRSALRRLAPVTAASAEFRRLPPGSVGRGAHVFRHTFASRLVLADVNLVKIADWMGHTDIRMTRRYVRLVRRYDPDIEAIWKDESE